MTPMELSNHIVIGGILGGKFTKEVTIIDTTTQEEIIVPMPCRIATNNINHNYVLLKSNEMIVSAFDDIETNHQYQDLIPVLPDYRMLEMKFYLLKNPYKNSANIEAFCTFLESCLSRQ